MILQAIKATTKVDQVNLVFSDGNLLPFPVDKINQFNLSKGQEIDNQSLHRLYSASLIFVLTNYALRLIGMSPQTSTTITSKLRIYLGRYLVKTKIPVDKEAQTQIIDHVIAYLQNNRLLNDTEYAKYLIHKLRNKSLQEIRYRLTRAGVSSDLIPTDSINEEEIIRKLVQKKLKSGSDLSDFITKNRIIAYLYRKGFPLESVKSVIDSMVRKR